MKRTGMLVVLLRGVNFGFWSRFRVFRAKRQYFMPPRSCLGFREETQNYAGLFFFHDSDYVFYVISLKLIACRICVFLSGLF